MKIIVNSSSIAWQWSYYTTLKLQLIFRIVYLTRKKLNCFSISEKHFNALVKLQQKEFGIVAFLRHIDVKCMKVLSGRDLPQHSHHSSKVKPTHLQPPPRA